LAGAFRAGEGGVTYVEVMIAMILMIVVLVGLLSAMTTSNVSQEMAKSLSRSQALARSLAEECQNVPFADVTNLDGDALVTADGFAGKISITSVSPGLVEMQVYAFKPANPVTESWLASASMAAVMGLERTKGSAVELVTLRAER
jgi:Tfp pilus assembly protein PilV